MLIRCNECGKEFSDKATACPNCGCPITYQNKTTEQNIVFNVDGVQINMDNLLIEYPDKVKAIKRIREITGADLKTATSAVEDYLARKNPSTPIRSKKSDSALSIIAFLITLFGCGCFSVVGVVLAIIDLSKNDTQKEHGWSKAALGIFVGWCLLWFLFAGDSNDNSETTQTVTTEITTEKLTTETVTTESQINIDDLKVQAQDVTYEDVYRNPETYKDEPIKITVYVEEYDTEYLGFVDVYYCSVDGQDIYITDYREVQEPTIAKGDTVTIYGLGSGMATLTESQKNIIGLTTDSEKSKIPSIDMYYVEIQ